MINESDLITLKNIKVVLIQTSHPGNIGSTARAMKTMGLRNLCLVNPKSFPDDVANAMASNAADLLESAKVVDSLQEAIADCHVVIGSSARHERSLSWDVFAPRRCGEVVADLLTKEGTKSKVALVFGRERTGLTNEELALCHHLVHIPTNPEYSSLNVASAVQILAYECRVGVLSDLDSGLEPKNKVAEQTDEEEIVTSNDMQGYYDQLEMLMIESEFLNPNEPRFLMSRIRRLYGRIQISRSELNILRGILSSFQKIMTKDR